MGVGVAAGARERTRIAGPRRPAKYTLRKPWAAPRQPGSDPAGAPGAGVKIRTPPPAAAGSNCMDNPVPAPRRARAVPGLLIAIFLLSEALLLANVVVYVMHAREASTRAAAAERQAHVPERIATVRGLVTAVESAARGHALTGDARHAVVHAAARRELEAALDALERTAAPEVASAADLARLRALVADELAITDALLARPPGTPPPEAATAGPALMAAIRAELATLALRTERELEARRAATVRAEWLTAGSLVAVTALAMLTIALFHRRMRRYLEERRAAEDRLTATNESLNLMVAERTGELTRLSGHLISSAEEEKAAFARELHDALGSNLTAVDIDVKWVEKKLRDREPELADRLRRALVVLEQAVDVKRNVIEALRPSLLDMLGLATALESLCEEFARRSGVDCIPDLDQELPELAPDVSIALYRVVQEALANVRAHAQAKTVRVALHREAEHLHLVVEDDGVGIPEDTIARTKSHGLVGMRERIRVLGGEFRLHAGAGGRGTVVDALVPRPA
ncbi:MAG: ATP-binding protein [Pseudomonadota bacterium]